jgi:hypothetical protein
MSKRPNVSGNSNENGGGGGGGGGGASSSSSQQFGSSRGASAAVAATHDSLSDTQLRVLYELNATKAILDDINATLQALVETTSPGGRLYDAQQIALGSFLAWERLFAERGNAKQQHRP